MSRVIIIHGWGSYPQKDWLPWAKKVAESKGYEVLVPAMPNSLSPKIEKWVPYLAGIVGSPREDDIFIGHSIGCQTILRFLETLPVSTKVKKVILVAPWMILSEEAFDDEEDKNIAKPWLETPINFEKVKSKADSFTAIFSDNDPYVPLAENIEIFKQQLGAEIVIETGKGHFTEDDGVTQLSELLKLLKA